jgi:hypothetical protein
MQQQQQQHQHHELPMQRLLQLLQLPMHEQQQLLELLSAAGPSETATYGSIDSCNGSAPLNLSGHGSSMDALVTAQAAASQCNSYSSVPEQQLHQHHAAAAAAANAGVQFSAHGGHFIPLGIDSMYGSQQQQGCSRGLKLDIGDDQLPPGFSAEDHTSSLPSSSTSAAAPAGLNLPGFSVEDYTTVLPSSSKSAAAAGLNLPGAFLQPAATVGMPVVTAAGTGTPSCSSIPTTAGQGVVDGSGSSSSSSVWAPLEATAGSAASRVAASVRALWPRPLTAHVTHVPAPPNFSATATAAAAGSHDRSAGDGYDTYGDDSTAGGSVDSCGCSQELEDEVAAATTSANVAELVLASPVSAPGAVDVQMSKVAKQIMPGHIEWDLPDELW